MLTVGCNNYSGSLPLALAITTHRDWSVLRRPSVPGLDAPERPIRRSTLRTSLTDPQGRAAILVSQSPSRAAPGRRHGRAARPPSCLTAPLHSAYSTGLRFLALAVLALDGWRQHT